MTRTRVCLIVDNPLRDLDGLVLIAWQLAQLNCEAWLVPMYEQAFDLRAINADFALVNYARFNNRSHLCSYMQEGIRVGILDTEGVGGRSADEFAALVGSDIGASLTDLYCVWGPSQATALVSRQIVDPDALYITGCPRYDYCAPTWRDAVPRPNAREGYVLINTNFPTVNPRFSSGSDDEVRTMIAAGFESAFAQAYVRDARAAQAGMIAVLDRIANRFPWVSFILRPHPFESPLVYQALSKRPNFEVRQEGTSIEWLNACKLLIHLNCSTAVEASMLGKTAISLSWLDTPTLKVEGPHSVSLHAVDPEDLITHLADRLNPASMPITKNTVHELIGQLYSRQDGQASKRVAVAILETMQKPVRVKTLPKLPLRFRYTLAARRVLGYRFAKKLQNFYSPRKGDKQHQAKLFTREHVESILHRLQACAPNSRPVEARSMASLQVAVPRWASGTSIRISASKV